MLHIVLVEPEIPPNTGNVSRLCVGLDATLHLVGRLGFSIDDRQLKRAGLDYWKDLRLERHESLEALHARWVAVLRAMTDADWRRAYRHPEYDRVIALDEVLAMYAHHGRHHVAQITGLRERQGWN